jgi:type IV pilus assembly protein PilC
LKIYLTKFFKAREKDLKWARIKDTIFFKIPVFGSLNQKNALYRWTATLAGGVSSGVPLSRAIEIAARTSGSVWHKAVAPKIDESLRSGRGLALSLADHKDLYPGNLRSMIATGEQTGEIAQMLDNVSNVIDSDIDAIVAGLSAKIEVMLLIVMGTVVGGMVLVLYLPIIQLATIQAGQ